MIREEIKDLIEKSIKELQKEGVFFDFQIPEIKIEVPEEKNYGDYATNIGMQLSSLIKKDSKVIARDIVEKIFLDKNLYIKAKSIFDKLDSNKMIAGPGFINFFLKKEYIQGQVGEIIKQREKFGQLKIGKKQKLNVEFISANPTGPLHIGNGRGGYCGDVLAEVLKKAGYNIFREYYVNDMGRQAEYLENSLNNREPSYKNSYIDELKNKGVKNIKEAIEFVVEKIKQTTERMGIKFDIWFYESELYEKGETDKILDFLKKNNLTYEKENALWFKSTKFGDDKDRVLIKKDEKQTYFLSDIAYLQNKFKRGFDYLIFFWGAEHHGYINRLKSVAEALGYKKDSVRPIIMQLVKLVEKGQEVKMSKRTGTYVTIDELIDEVGEDIARFFFLTRTAGSHLIFDMDLAKEQSEKNPVCYIQYAHARICSILRKSQNSEFSINNLGLLNHSRELELIKKILQLPEVIKDCARDYQLQRIPQYALELANAFHQFYDNPECKVLTDDENLKEARLNLVLATQIVLKNTLDLMGISAPEKM